jgi:hypothetical protein
MVVRIVASCCALALLAGCSAEGQRAQELLQQAEVAQQALESSTFEGRVSLEADGQAFGVTFKGATSAEGEWVSLSAKGLPGGGDFSLQLLRRGSRAWTNVDGGWQATPLPSSPRAGASATLSAGAFQQLAQHVKAVRVTEHEVIGGKPVALIAGEIDTAGMLETLAQFGSAAGKPEGLSLDFSDLGIELGDIEAVLTVDERTHLLDAALVTFSIEAKGKRVAIELRYRLTSANEPVRLPTP